MYRLFDINSKAPQHFCNSTRVQKRCNQSSCHFFYSNAAMNLQHDLGQTHSFVGPMRHSFHRFSHQIKTLDKSLPKSNENPVKENLQTTQNIIQKKSTNEASGSTKRVKSTSWTAKHVRKVNADGSSEEIITNREETSRSIKSGTTELKTRLCEEFTQHKDTHVQENTRGIHERKSNRSHKAITIKSGSNGEETDEQIDSEEVDIMVTEYLDKDGKVQRTTTHVYHHPTEPDNENGDNKDKNKNPKNKNKSNKNGHESSQKNNNANNKPTVSENTKSKSYTSKENENSDVLMSKNENIVNESCQFLSLPMKEIREKKSFVMKEMTRRICRKQSKGQIIEEIVQQMGMTLKEEEQIHFNNSHLIALKNLLHQISAQTQQSQVLRTLQKFWREDFLPDFQGRVWPIIYNAYLKDDIDYLSNVCIGKALLFCREMIDQRKEMNRQLSDKVLAYDPVELIDIKFNKQYQPLLILTANVHTINCTYDRVSGDIIDGNENSVAQNTFLLVLEPNLKDSYLRYSGYPWQIRLLQTTKQKQFCETMLH